MLDVKLYESDGTFIRTLAATDVQIDSDGTRSVRRTASFTTPIAELADLQVFGRRIKIFEKATDEILFDGYYDDVVATADSKIGTIRISCRDKSKLFKEAAFAEDQTFADSSAIDTGQLIASALATSFLAAGYEIQEYADVYEQTVTVYEIGVAKRINDAVITGDIRDNLIVSVSGSQVQKVVLDVYLDLKAAENIQQIQLRHTGYYSQIRVSLDGIVWTNYTGGLTSCRYIHVQITGDLSFNAGIQIYAGTSYPAVNVLSDDELSWRPALNDLQREITFDTGSPLTANVLYLRWGLNDAERRTLVKYEILAQLASGWRSLGTWFSNAGLAEAVFENTTARYWKVRVLDTWEGRPAMRYAKLARVVATDTVDQVIKNIAQSEGEAQLNLTPTKRRVNATFEAGQSKWDAMQKIVTEVLGDWELFFDRAGVLTLKPKVLRTDQPRKVTALLPPFSVTFSDADVKNEIIAIYEGQDSTLRYVIQNNNAASSTSIPRIGRRTEVVKSSLADTPEKLATFAQRELATRGRVTVPAEATIVAAAGYETWDVWHVTEGKTGIDGLFILNAFTITANMEQATYDLKAKLEAI